MEHLELWKLATDIGLVASLLVLCYRFLRSPELPLVSRRSQELEQVLRSLVQEADAASKSLHDKLTRRQQSLEKLLFDIGTVESRVNRAISNADEEKQFLSSSIAEAKKLAEEVKDDISRERRMITRGAETFTARPQPTNRSPLSSSIEVEVDRPIDPPKASEPKPASSVNIYGEEISTRSETPIEEITPSAPPRGIRAYSGLSASIEKQVEPQNQAPVATQPAAKATQTRSTGTQTLEDLFRAAEKMLLAGQDLQSIAASLKLPVDQVKLLMELMRGEEVPTAPIVKSEDPRLGALASRGKSATVAEPVAIKRQVQVL